ncbi:unnamed protein product [Adineta steineri]|uniref:Fucosyltransferase n=1 Tax=Adineta steineri TaxID=433720 RepID=A0A818XR47_9BILA|nr:unnamed protein product [Adineta steineri]CAF3744402.1 unnamed protein product [Adineta steineri]
MYLRVSRLRCVLVRCSILLIILLFLLEIRIFVKNTISSTTTTNPIEISFWQKLDDQDKLLTNEKKIELIEKYRKKYDLNWTNIFHNIYKRKIEKLYQKDMKNDYKYIIMENMTNIPQKTFVIFEETPVFQQPKFCSSKLIFHPQCPYTNCEWKCQNSPINDENIRRASVFHHVDINTDEMHVKLKTRSHNDIWILWIDEANRQLKHLNQYKFNWTLSFRQDSEISIGTYGLLIENNSNKKSYSTNTSDLILSSDFLYILTNRNILITDFTIENHILTNYRYRSKHALWFVSNCEPKARLNYYERLKNYFPINAFGSCINNAENKCNKNDRCEFEQSRLALFYLAFESQTCTDYITEKFWRALHYGMIPIVFGPNKQSYLDLDIPPSAFIHVDDFKSAKQLGEYLHKVANDYFLYREYFQWFNQYEIFYQTNDLEPIRMCELCMRLNMQNGNEHRFYTNIHRWHRTEC